MLAAMRERAFVVAIAYVKTEPLQIAAFGFVVLGEALGAQALLAVGIATAGVLLMSLPANAVARGPALAGGDRERAEAAGALARLRPALLGIGSGAMFALSAVGFRGAIVGLGDAPFYARATFTLAVSLAAQTALLSTWLLARDPATLREILRAWRPSLLAGASGALASQMWFLAFSLQTAAAVRTVGLVEILFAQAASRRLFAQRESRREALGIALTLAGLLLLLAG
jgi:drug/metabolite transporter (DMT)-like permease